MNFIKMCSLGNDFVFINKTDIWGDLRDDITRIADRKHGIGCDQVIYFSRNHEARFFNRDGTEAEMCGNGIRALGALLYKMYGVTQATITTIKSNVEIEITDKELVQTSIPICETNYTPEYTEEILRYAQSIVPACEHAEIVNVGNPHIVLFTQSEEPNFEIYGHNIDSCVKGGINVGFARIGENLVFLNVFERGSGYTLACGSGACAAAIAAKHYKLQDREEILIHQRGGDLTVRVTDTCAITTGTATLVFSGEFYEN